MMEALIRLGLELERIPAETESWFMSMGHGLDGYHKRAVRISGLCSSAAMLLSGQMVEGGMEALRGLLERTGAYAANPDRADDLRDRDCLHRVMERMGSSLKLFGERRSESSVALASLSGWSKEICRSMQGVVMAVQAHDITRQRLDKARRSCSELRRRLEAGQAGVDEAVADFCEGLSAELSGVRDSLAAAVEGIVSSLGDIAFTLKGMSDYIRRIVGSAEASGRSFLEDMSSDLAYVKDSLLHLFEADASVGALHTETEMRSLIETMRHVNRYVAGRLADMDREVGLLFDDVVAATAQGAVLRESLGGVVGRAFDTLSAIAEGVGRPVGLLEGPGGGSEADRGVRTLRPTVEESLFTDIPKAPPLRGQGAWMSGRSGIKGIC